MKYLQAFSLFAFAFLPIISAALTVNTTMMSAGKRDAGSIAAALKNAAAALTNYKGHRDKFPQNIVDELHTANPHYNYVVAHGFYQYSFDGAEGVDWGRTGMTYSGGKHRFVYEIFIGGSGVFYHEAKGPQYSINLAYQGNVIVAKKTVLGGVNIVFGKPR